MVNMNNQHSNFSDFIEGKGRPLSEINPGSEEFALNLDDAEKGIEMLRLSDSVIFGGDILSLDADNILIYAYQKWGSEYHFLNWSCEKERGESEFNYRQKSYRIAKESIDKARMISELLGETCYVVLVVGKPSR